MQTGLNLKTGDWLVLVPRLRVSISDYIWSSLAERERSKENSRNTLALKVPDPTTPISDIFTEIFEASGY